ncbi:MAG: hypothetical protein B7Y90_06720 [Alphaproteobacteria bacterium 32-64-14]|nr:MAG: hypothetical protein B7Y90_06720 [Alphaproteobacteria bacterium 32-64-14]
MAHTPLFASLTSAIERARAGLPGGAGASPRAISRRAALAMMAAAAACSAEQDRGPEHDPDAIAIVGGGASGLVAAWRLANAGRACEVFEASGRTGGRMYTLRDFTPEGHFCDLGGEFVAPVHTALITLCRELGVGLQTLRADNETGTNIYDIGGVRLADDLIDPATAAGAFVPVAARIAADQAALLDSAGGWTQRAHDLDALPLSKYLESLAGSTERWVIDLLALAYLCEHGIAPDRQSSLNLVDAIGTDTAQPFGPFGHGGGLLRIARGSASLPEALTARLMASPASARTSLHMRHTLSAIARAGEAFRLTFENEGKPPAVRTFKRVVLALPFTRLRTVKGLGGLGLPADKMKVINEQGYGANAKLVVGTSSRPWTGTLPDLHAPMTGSLYSDKGFQQVWESSIGQSGDGGVLTNYLAGPPARSEEASVLATLERGLKALSPEFATSLSPRMRASMFWPSHPHTRGSYSGALAGQYTSFREIGARSELGGGLAFAGEHTSLSWAGSMNGAVDAGERVARELLAQA